MKNLLTAILLIISINFTKNAIASFFAASDLTYTCLGGNTYLISAAIYRDCSGASAQTLYTANFSCSTNSNFNFTANLYPISGTGYEVTPGCSTQPTTCNGGSVFGVREYIYQATVTMIPCADWIISIQGCCRNPITSIYNNQYNQFYIRAFLNNLNAPCNSSPTFSNIPIAKVCNNMNFCFNHGSFDPNGDSLVYSFSAPRTLNETTSIVYNPPYSASTFMASSTPITIDYLSGDICFTPTSTIFTLTGVKIEEYRTINGIPTLIGTVYRDILIYTEPCPNEIPKLSGMDFTLSHHYSPSDTQYFNTTMAGTLVNFDINGFDADTFNPNLFSSPEVMHILWNNGIPQGTFAPHFNGTDSAYANFQWTPTSSDVSASPKCFTATVHDETYTYYGIQTYMYCIFVNTNPGLDISENQADFQILPNPSSGIISLKFTNWQENLITYKIFSNTGKLLKDALLNNEKSIANFKLDLSKFPKGLYYITIRGKEFVKTKKIILY